MKMCKTNRIISCLMACLMLLSSTGFSIDLHYCQGNLKSFSLLGKAKSCHEISNSCKQKKMTCHASASKQDEVGKCKKDCCQNKSIEISPDVDRQKIPIEKLASSQSQFILAFVAAFVLEESSLWQCFIPHQNYVPPFLDKDIPILIQSFLL